MMIVYILYVYSSLYMLFMFISSLLTLYSLDNFNTFYMASFTRGVKEMKRKERSIQSNDVMNLCFRHYLYYK